MSLRIILSLLLATFAAGCSVRLGGATPDDALRERVLNLESENRLLTQRVAELETEISLQTDIAQELPHDIRLNTPHVTRVSISPLSHLRDSDDDGRVETLVLYLNPEDGRGRFTQMVGRVSVSASLLPADAEAKTLGLARFGPREVRDAYRSGFTGTHYTLECPIEPPPAGFIGALNVVVRFENGLNSRIVQGAGQVAVRPGIG